MYYIQFYNRGKGSLARKPGYKTKREAEADLRKHGFFPAGGDVWDSFGYIARIKEDK